MAITKQRNKTTTGIIVLIAIVAIWFLFLRGPECITDQDCPIGEVCSFDGKCVAYDPVIKRDNICPDNTYPIGAYDPDCPYFCPFPTERTGGGRICCGEPNGPDAIYGYISVDCNTRVPNNLFPEVTFTIPEQKPAQEWFDLMAVVIWGAEPAKAFTGPVWMTADATAGVSPLGATGHEVWLDVNPTIKTDPGGVTEPIFYNAWNDCRMPDLSSCIGPTGTLTIPEGQTSSWISEIVNADDIAHDLYQVVFSFCGDEYPSVEGIPSECPTDIAYSMEVGPSGLDFWLDIGFAGS